MLLLLSEHLHLCRAVYTRYNTDPDPSINIFMVVLMAALGAGVVVGVPRLLNRCVAVHVPRWHCAKERELMASDNVDFVQEARKWQDASASD